MSMTKKYQVVDISDGWKKAREIDTYTSYDDAIKKIEKILKIKDGPDFALTIVEIFLVEK